MRTVFDHTECQNLKTALRKEWLETNGLGGFASSTIIGANTRRQHGLLVAALRPPGERQVLLAKYEEQVLAGGHEAYLSTNLYPGTVYPHGFNIQQEFRLRPWPTFRYTTNEFDLEKTVTLIHGENTVVVGYRNLKSRGAVTLRVRPLLAYRDYSALGRQNAQAALTSERSADAVVVQPLADQPRLFFHVPGAEVAEVGQWYYRLTYPVEAERGLDSEEDLMVPVEFGFRLGPGQTVYLVASTENKSGVKPAALIARERDRRLHYESETDPVRRALWIASEAFIVRRGADQFTMLAGYPWFTDRGRDTMIALPGVTLTTGRTEIARRILLSFVQYCDQGMIPNVFPDRGVQLEYNSVDASLWFVVAAWRYWKATADKATLRQLLPALSSVVKHYQAGTRFDIRADADGLITAGTQLTWMDVNVDGYVPTPRHGKAVEVNALWLNGLRMLSELQEKVAQNIHAAMILRKMSDWVAGSFQKIFWNDTTGCLYDVVRGGLRDPAVRPNQLFAVSLPYSPLSQEQQQSVFAVITQQLLTPYGLRSLARDHEKYCGRYTGNRWQRDCAYHQGTVWPWLIGPYCDAYIKLHGHGKPQREHVRRLLQPLLDSLEDAGLGTISEIFEGDPPHRPDGCIAQAWSVAEVLRVYDASR